ncbi:MAG TPA: DUF3341 domain-containing protein [Opitutaceae bacterium]|jgi:hypothetical protein
MSGAPFGTVAAFGDERSFLDAIAKAQKAGFRRIETFTPHNVEGEAALLRRRPTPVSWIMLAAGILGGAGAFYMQWYAVHDFRHLIDVGGRPVDSWPSFIPITFELTVLTAALVGTAAMLWLAGLPRLDHPLFGSAGFERASQDRYLVCVLAEDPRYTPAAARDALLPAGPEAVNEVTK